MIMSLQDRVSDSQFRESFASLKNHGREGDSGWQRFDHEREG